MDPQQQFCLKWNSYSSNLAMTFSNLFKSELLADVTLFCGGKLIQNIFTAATYKTKHSYTQIHINMISIKTNLCLDKIFHILNPFLMFSTIQMKGVLYWQHTLFPSLLLPLPIALCLFLANARSFWLP